MGLFNSFIDLVDNVTSVVLTPVELAVDIASKATEEVAKVAKDLADDVRSVID